MENNIPSNIEETDFFKENANLVDFFNNSCAKHSEKIAFESFDVEMSFDELSVQVNSFASWLSQNFKPGDRIAVMMPNMLAYPVIVYGALMAGVIVVNINPLYTPRELEHVLRDSEAKLLLVFEGVAHVVEKSDLASVDKVVVTTVGDLLGFKGKIIQGVIDLYYALQNNDDEKAVHAYTQWGFANMTKNKLEVLNKWAEFIYSPLMEDKVQKIQQSDSGIYGAQVAAEVHKELKKLGGVKPPKEFVFMDRAAVGLGSVFMHLKAEVNWYKIFHSLIENFETKKMKTRQQKILKLVKL